jgi:hypothetical protein
VSLAAIYFIVVPRISGLAYEDHDVDVVYSGVVTRRSHARCLSIANAFALISLLREPFNTHPAVPLPVAKRLSVQRKAILKEERTMCCSDNDAVDEEKIILCCACCCANCGLYTGADCPGCSGKIGLCCLTCQVCLKPGTFPE